MKHIRRVGNKVDGDIKSIVFYCCNDGPPVLKVQKRRTINRKTGCNFKFPVHLQAEVFQVLIDVAEHNHELFVHSSMQPSGGPSTLEQQISVIFSRPCRAHNQQDRCLTLLTISMLLRKIFTTFDARVKLNFFLIEAPFLPSLTALL